MPFSRNKLLQIAVVVLRVVLGGIFIYAGYVKLAEPWQLFAAGIADYEVVPMWAAKFLAHTLPWFEVLIGLLLIPAPALDHRRFWDAMHAVTLDQLEQISQAIAVRIVGLSGLDCSSVALDMTNFATFIDTGNAKAPVAQRGKAKQKRTDLRLVGLGLVVTRDGGIPLTWHAYPGDRPDVTQFATMIGQLRGQYAAVCAASGAPAADMTVVFDAGQNSEDNFAHLAGTGLHYVGSVPASGCPDLTALPASARAVAGQERFGGLTAHDRSEERRV